ncbi:MAG: 16S rRNA (cytidine(1402)-2'-O)-methyltransferase [Gammaproteobacteria bacterium]
MTVSNDGPTLSIDRPALYVVATPIGNLADISTRALQILEAADLLLVEDKRVSSKLLQSYGIRTRMQIMHDHNERGVADGIVANLIANSLVAAQICDAGTPLISDPGYALINAAHEHGLAIHPIPGPCAAISALSVSGLPTDQFVFVGFLNAKPAAKMREVAALANETRTLIFYEAPHRIKNTLSALGEKLGSNRRAVIARELTKRFETLYRGNLAELAARAEQDPNMEKGELVIVVEGAIGDDADSITDARRMLGHLLSELPLSQAVRLTAKITGAKKNTLYQWATEDAASGGPAEN